MPVFRVQAVNFKILGPILGKMKQVSTNVYREFYSFQGSCPAETIFFSDFRS